MIGVILAAGDGKRLKKSSNEDSCKPLIKVNGKRLIEYSLDNLIELHIDKAFIVVGKEGDLIQRVLGNEYKGLQIFYVIQDKQTGLIDAFVQAVDAIGYGETVILQLSDEIFTELKAADIRKCIEEGAYEFYCGITFEDNAEKIKNNYSVDSDSDYCITKCVEKPVVVTNNFKGTGFCSFTREALMFLKDKKENDSLIDLCDYINFLLSKGKKGLALEIAKKEFNVNTFADLLEAQDYLETNSNI